MEQMKQFILVGTEKPSEREEWILRTVNQLLEIDAEGVLIAFEDDETEHGGFAVHHCSIANMLNIARGALAEAVSLMGVSLDQEDNGFVQRIYRKRCKVSDNLDSLCDGLKEQPE